MLSQDCVLPGFADGGAHYPPKSEHAKLTATHFDRDPGLHHFLWISLQFPRIAHCADLAAAFRLVGRIVGVGGAMDVNEFYPWPPWDSSGNRRALFVGSQPGQGSLRPFVAGNAQCCFFDGFGYANRFEGVLRWLESGSKSPVFYAIGERICDYRDPSASTKELDERNARLFFQAANDITDITTGKYRLAMIAGDNRLRAPAFSFLTHSNQTLFKFHYEKHTFAPGDDRQIRGGKLK